MSETSVLMLNSNPILHSEARQWGIDVPWEFSTGSQLVSPEACTGAKAAKVIQGNVGQKGALHLKPLVWIQVALKGQVESLPSWGHQKNKVQAAVEFPAEQGFSGVPPLQFVSVVVLLSPPSVLRLQNLTIAARVGSSQSLSWQ
jgi:hypothetical protein